MLTFYRKDIYSGEKASVLITKVFILSCYIVVYIAVPDFLGNIYKVYL